MVIDVLSTIGRSLHVTDSPVVSIGGPRRGVSRIVDRLSQPAGALTDLPLPSL